MLHGFSTLGDPGLTLAAADALAERFGMDFLELRALEGSVDLAGLFPGTGRIVTRTPVRVVASSLQLLATTEKDVEELKRLAELAARMDARYVRIFGGGRWETEPTEEEMARAARMVERCREAVAAWPGELLLETHSAFSSSGRCEALNARLAEPVGILWDSHHTWQKAGEAPEDTWRALGPLVRHVHFKDSLGTEGYPTGELLATLRRKDFPGGLSLEWEKMWQPELEPLEKALGAFREILFPAGGAAG